MAEQIHYSLSKRILMIILIFVCAVFGVFLCVLGFSPYNGVELVQKTNNDLDYTVSLKDNNYFEKNVLPSGGKYISNLIDHFNVSFKYNSEFTQPVSGSYSYQIIATISANESKSQSSASYWSREFKLFQSDAKEIRETRSLTFTDEVKVDYDVYNNLLRDFKMSYSLSAMGKLEVSLVITGDLTNSLFSNKMPLKSEMSISVPLTEQAVEVSINTDAKNKEQILASTPKMTDSAIIACRIAGLLFVAITIIAAFASRHVGRIKEAGAEYELNVKKLLSSYDSIIVDLKSAPNLAGIKVSEVDDFDELLDVYNSIHQPINFYTSRNTSIFIIINEKMAWKFTVRLSDYK